MVKTDCAKSNPSLLQPSGRTAYHQGPRLYHYTNVWKALSDTDLDLIQLKQIKETYNNHGSNESGETTYFLDAFL